MLYKRSGIGRIVWLVIAIVVIALVASVGIERVLLANSSPPSARQSTISQIEGMGFSPDVASYIASSNTSLISTNSTSAEFLVTFPSNATAEVSYTVSPNQTVAPTQADLANSTNGIYNVTISVANSSSSSEIITLSYYFVNTTSSSSSSSSSSLSILSSVAADVFLSHAPAGDSAPSMSVHAGGTHLKLLNGGTSHEVSHVFHILENIKIGLNTVLAIGEGHHIYEEFGEWYNQLLALEECAQNPTNPLTISGYNQDPGQEQKILDSISSAKVELQELTIARFLNIAVGLGSDLLPHTPLSKFIDVAVLFAENYSEATLKNLSEELVKSIRNMVTPCTTSSTNGTTSSNSGSATLASIASSASSMISSGSNGGSISLWTGVFRFEEFSSSASGTIDQVWSGSFNFMIHPDSTITGSGTGTNSVTETGSCSGSGSTGYSFSISGGYIPYGNGSNYVSLEPGDANPLYFFVTINCGAAAPESVQFTIAGGFYPRPVTIPAIDGATVQGIVGAPGNTYKFTIHGGSSSLSSYSSSTEISSTSTPTTTITTTASSVSTTESSTGSSSSTSVTSYTIRTTSTTTNSSSTTTP